MSPPFIHDTTVTGGQFDSEVAELMNSKWQSQIQTQATCNAILPLKCEVA